MLPGASAKLVQAGDDILAGLHVKVAFGGLWKESLMELSGGQRSLVALSLAVEGWAANAAAFADFDLSSAGVLFCLSYLATVLGFGGWGRLLNAYGAGRIAPFSLLVPIFGMTAAAILLDESFGPVRLAAAALVVFGLCLTVLKPAHLRLRAAR